MPSEPECPSFELWKCVALMRTADSKRTRASCGGRGGDEAEEQNL
jgi:hypothetical protein